ncbi:MAG: protein phosphatase 2C domain-containing protein [Planctomycetota bacterium]
MNGKTSQLRSQAPGSSRDTQLTLEICGESDIGVGRRRNEDDGFVADLTRDVCSMEPKVHVWIGGERGALLGVADGVGGAPGGDIASRLATRLVFKHYRERLTTEPTVDADTVQRCLEYAMQRASELLFAHNADVPFQQRKGTTVTVAAILGPQLFVAQVGDSRAYLARDGELFLITKDQVTESGNFIAQAMGVMSPLEIEIYPITLREGDRLLLCTDGLSKFVKNEEIRRLASRDAPLPECVDALVAAARSNMGPKGDNVTVLLGNVSREPIRPRPEAEPQEAAPAATASKTADVTLIASPERSRLVDWIAWSLAALLGLLLWLQLRRAEQQASQIQASRELVERALDALRDEDQEIGRSLLEDAQRALKED